VVLTGIQVFAVNGAAADLPGGRQDRGIPIAQLKTLLDIDGDAKECGRDVHGRESEPRFDQGGGDRGGQLERSLRGGGQRSRRPLAPTNPSAPRAGVAVPAAAWRRWLDLRRWNTRRHSCQRTRPRSYRSSRGMRGELRKPLTVWNNSRMRSRAAASTSAPA